MRSILVSALLLAVAGCAAPKLVPATAATTVPGRENVAVEEVANVRFTVATNVWRGAPGDLPRVLTPVRVSIENRSGRPVRIRYQEFALVGQSGFRYAAIPPLSTQGQAVSQKPGGEAPQGPDGGMPQEPGGETPATPAFAEVEETSPPESPPSSQLSSSQLIVRPRLAVNGFYVAPWYHPYYPGFSIWPGWFPYDPFYYNYYYGWWREPLPSRDMLERALPEGVLQDGGRITGFLYFNDVEREGAVNFQADVIDAESNEKLGTVTIPFVVRR